MRIYTRDIPLKTNEAPAHKLPRITWEIQFRKKTFLKVHDSMMLDKGGFCAIRWTKYHLTGYRLIRYFAHRRVRCRFDRRDRFDLPHIAIFHNAFSREINSSRLAERGGPTPLISNVRDQRILCLSRRNQEVVVLPETGVVPSAMRTTGFFGSWLLRV